MKKKNIIGLVLIALVSFIPQLSIQAQQINKEFKVSQFHNLDLTTVGNVYFTQDKKCSVMIEGKKENVDLCNIHVENNTLCIEPKDEVNANNNKVSIYITAPLLKELEFCGVGKLYCNEALKLDDFKCTLQGVGKMYIRNLTCKKLEAEIEGIGKAEIHVKCKELKAEVDGIGSLTLSGTTDKAEIERGGIGIIDTDDLKVGK